MTISIKKPCTVYISFTGQIPDVFKLYHEKHGLYFFRQLLGKIPRIKFNLCHSGIYTSPSDFSIVKVVDIEIPDNLPSLPAYERSDIRDFVIVDNPELDTPAQIYRKEGVVIKGNKFYQHPKPVRVYILLHEIGHFFYGITEGDISKANRMNEETGKAYLKARQLESEKKCDLFALITYLSMGYNRSMAYYSLNTVLSRSTDNIKRVKELLNNIGETQSNVL